MGEVNFTPIAPIVAQTRDTITYELNREQAAPINKCGFDLQSANSIMVEVPKNNKDGRFQLGITRNIANSDIQSSDYCAFDGKNITETQVMTIGSENKREASFYTECDVKPNDKTIEYNCSFGSGPIHGLQYFQNKK